MFANVFSEAVDNAAEVEGDDENDECEIVPFDFDEDVVSDFLGLGNMEEETLDEDEEIKSVFNHVFVRHRHATCAAHKLQLVLKDVFENTHRMKQLRQVLSGVHCFMKSLPGQ
jgi:hypothetical protein